MFCADCLLLGKSPLPINRWCCLPTIPTEVLTGSDSANPNCFYRWAFTTKNLVTTIFSCCLPRPPSYPISAYPICVGKRHISISFAYTSNRGADWGRRCLPKLFSLLGIYTKYFGNNHFWLFACPYHTLTQLELTQFVLVNGTYLFHFYKVHVMYVRITSIPVWP